MVEVVTGFRYFPMLYPTSLSDRAPVRALTIARGAARDRPVLEPVLEPQSPRPCWTL